MPKAALPAPQRVIAGSARLRYSLRQADDLLWGKTMALCVNQEDQKQIRYAARQPILSVDENVFGYKLLFRTDVRNWFPAADHDLASRAVIDMTSLIGLKTLCDNRLAFICSTREILVGEYLTLLPAEKVVAEIADTVPADAEVKEACQFLKSAGCKIALGNFTADDPRESLVDLADFIKIDIRRTSLDDISQLAARYHSHSSRMLAEKVETREDFEFTKRAGFHYFQGYFFRRPEMMRARGVQSNRAIFLRLLQAVSKPDLDWKEIEDIVKKDPMLYYRLLRYLNSAAFGFSGEVRSVTQALNILGEKEIRRWCRLAGMLELSQNRPSDLALSALVRARFGELISVRVEHGTADLFQLGLMSLIDAILEIPMRMAIDGLPLDPESRTLLLDHEGPLLPIYELVMAVEAGFWPNVVSLCKILRLPEEFIAKSYWNAMEWAESILSTA